MRRSDRAKRSLRGFLAAVGAACIVLALSADLIGVGQPGGFGRGQLLVALAGAGMLFLLLLGPGFINFYKMAAIILLNTVVLLAGLELTAILVSRTGWFPSKWEAQLSRQRSAPYYGTREWADQFWLESQGVEHFRYEPDGVNDVLAAYESGRPGAHVTMSKIAGQFEKRDHPLVTWLLQSRLVAVTRGLFDLSVHLAASPMKEQEIGVLAKSVSEVYLHNYRVLRALAEEYDFRLYCFWQPHLAVGKKLLTEAEQAALDRLDKSLRDLFLPTYQNIKSAAPEYSRLWYLADVFSGEEDQIWIDEWGHVTPQGNRLVAEKMLAVVLSDEGS